jgi:cation transport ATPase
MERIKLAIADKILETTSQDDETMKQNLSRIRRFSDFAEACKSLMVKYPEIEDELLEMVRTNDFDTSRASRRVDFIINKSTLSASSSHPLSIQADVENFGQPVDTDLSSENVDEFDSQKNTDAHANDTSFISENDIGRHYSEHAGYVDADEEIVYATLNEEEVPDDRKLKKQKQQKIFSIVWKTLAVILVLILIYLIVKFVVNYWKYILTVLLVLAIIVVSWVYYKKRNK